MSVGVIAHLHNPTRGDVSALAEACEDAGADWLGLADAFWWRDVWVLLVEAARVSERIEIGPVVTNPYMRHRFHTLAALATLQDVAGPRVMLGLGAGGSELSGAAGISRADAPRRVLELSRLVRAVASGAPLDPRSGRTLEVPLQPVPIMIAGRGRGLLDVAGRVGDRALVWAVPTSELARAVATVNRGADDGREAPGGRPRIVWAPLVAHDAESFDRVRSIAAYSVLNSRAAVRERWGVTAEVSTEIRRRLVAGGARAAMELIPQAAIADLVLADHDPATAGTIAASIGADALAVPAFNVTSVGERVDWARSVLAAASRS